MRLWHQTVQVGISRREAVTCDWEGNRVSGIAVLYPYTGSRPQKASTLRALTCHMGSRKRYLSLDRGNLTAFTRRIKAGTRFSDPEWMHG